MNQDIVRRCMGLLYVAAHKKDKRWSIAWHTFQYIKANRGW